MAARILFACAVCVGAGFSGVGFSLPTSRTWGEEAKFKADAAQAEAAAGELSSTQWKARLKAWRKSIPMERLGGRPPRYKVLGGAELEAVRKQVAAIRDPAAVPALEAMLLDKSVALLDELWLAPLKDIPGEAAFILLVRMSVEHESEPIRRAAAEAVAKSENPADAIERYIKYLKSPKYCTWAAVSLRQAGLTQRVSSTQPIDEKLAAALIQALVLPEKVRVGITERVGSASSSGAGNLHRSVRNQHRTAIIDVPVSRLEVHKTLVEYGGVDHGFDESAWKAWLAQQQAEARSG